MALQVLLSCVAEDRPTYHARVETLVGSARRLGGSLSRSPIIINMLQSADPAFVRRMENFDAEVRIVPRFDGSGTAYANKLRMLDLVDDRDDFDILLAVDCDIAVVEDPVSLLSSDAINVVPADLDPLTEKRWRDLLTGLDITPGARSVRAGMTGRSMYPYFNSGVVAIPRELCAELLAAWTQALRDVSGLWERHMNIVPRAKRVYTDQYALMTALRRGLPWTVASRELNFATHVALHGPGVYGLRPALLHYHDAVDEDGFLLRPRSMVAEAAAERVNHSRAQALGLSYHGLRARPLHSQVRRTIGGYAATQMSGLAMWARECVSAGKHTA
jgi:hypothetical protein